MLNRYRPDDVSARLNVKGLVLVLFAVQLALGSAAASCVVADDSRPNGLSPEQEALCRLPEGPAADSTRPEDVAAVLGVAPASSWYPVEGDDRFVMVLYAFSETTGVLFEFAKGRLVAGTGDGAAGHAPSGEVGATFWANRGIPKEGGFIGFEPPDWDGDACLAVFGCGGPSHPWGSEPHCPLSEDCGGPSEPWGSAARCPCPPDSAISDGTPRPPGC
jgi:hypothetical protein